MFENINVKESWRMFDITMVIQNHTKSLLSRRSYNVQFLQNHDGLY